MHVYIVYMYTCMYVYIQNSKKASKYAYQIVIGSAVHFYWEGGGGEAREGGGGEGGGRGGKKHSSTFSFVVFCCLFIIFCTFSLVKEL